MSKLSRILTQIQNGLKKKKKPSLVEVLMIYQCVCLWFQLSKAGVGMKTNSQGSPSALFYIGLNGVLRFPKLVQPFTFKMYMHIMNKAEICGRERKQQEKNLRNKAVHLMSQIMFPNNHHKELLNETGAIDHSRYNFY